MVAYLVGLACGFSLGWLARLWRSERVDRRRRGGWIRPGASSTMSQQTDMGRQISFSSSPLPGQAWEEAGILAELISASNTRVPTYSGSATDGRETGLTRLDSVDCLNRAWDEEYFARYGVPRLPGSAEPLTMDQTSSLAS